MFSLSFSQKARLEPAVSRPWKCRCLPFRVSAERKPRVPRAAGRGQGSRCQEECPLDTWLGAQQPGCQAQEGVPTPVGSSGGRKEVMQDRISPSRGLQSSWLQSPDKQAILLLTWLGGCKIPPIQLDFKRPFLQQGCEGKVAEPWHLVGCLTAGTPGVAQSCTEELGGAGVSHPSSPFCLLGLLHLCPSLPAGLDSHTPWERHGPSDLPPSAPPHP